MQFASSLTSFLSPTQNATQQSPKETILKISERCMHANQLEDRRAAVMGLKGLSKDFRKVDNSKGGKERQSEQMEDETNKEQYN